MGNIEDSAEELAFHSPPVVQTSSNATVKESTNLSSTSVTVVNNNNNNKLVKEESTNISCVIATFSNSNHFINEEQVTSGHSCVDETCEILRDPTYEKEQHATQEIAMTNDETATKNDTTVSDGSSSIDSTKTSRKDEDSWEKLYSDTGDCLDPTLIDEVSGIHTVYSLRRDKI